VEEKLLDLPPPTGAPLDPALLADPVPAGRQATGPQERAR
jgi:hypothetical protein